MRERERERERERHTQRLLCYEYAALFGNKLKEMSQNAILQYFNNMKLNKLD